MVLFVFDKTQKKMLAAVNKTNESMSSHLQRHPSSLTIHTWSKGKVEKPQRGKQQHQTTNASCCEVQHLHPTTTTGSWLCYGQAMHMSPHLDLLDRWCCFKSSTSGKKKIRVEGVKAGLPFGAFANLWTSVLLSLNTEVI